MVPQGKRDLAASGASIVVPLMNDRRARILVIAETPRLRMLAVAALDVLRFHVVVATGTDGGIAALQHEGPFDVILHAGSDEHLDALARALPASTTLAVVGDPLKLGSVPARAVVVGPPSDAHALCALVTSLASTDSHPLPA